jgi:signal transduction histidine kinase
MLDDLGLNATLEWLCREFTVLNGIPCKFISSYNEANLSHEVKMDFFRISQASLTNVMYHAQANNVWISVEDIGDLITLTVTDDGMGFSTDEHSQAIGLKRMHDRATSINGHLVINSEAGKGTRVCVSVPKLLLTDNF